MPNFHRQLMPEQVQLIRVLIKLTQAKRALDIGTFRGYSALAIALELPPNGTVITIDIREDKWMRDTKRFWAESGAGHKIRFIKESALSVLEQLLLQDQHACFDFACIDADKKNNLRYFELVMELLRPGGVVVIDNVFWQGEVLDTDTSDATVKIIQRLNKQLHNDKRIIACVIPLGDGMTIAVKK